MPRAAWLSVVPHASLHCAFQRAARHGIQDFAGRSLKVDISLPKEKGKGGKVPYHCHSWPCRLTDAILTRTQLAS